MIFFCPDIPLYSLCEYIYIFLLPFFHPPPRWKFFERTIRTIGEAKGKKRRGLVNEVFIDAFITQFNINHDSRYQSR